MFLFRELLILIFLPQNVRAHILNIAHLFCRQNLVFVSVYTCMLLIGKEKDLRTGPSKKRHSVFSLHLLVLIHGGEMLGYR